MNESEFLFVVVSEVVLMFEVGSECVVVVMKIYVNLFGVIVLLFSVVIG